MPRKKKAAVPQPTELEQEQTAAVSHHEQVAEHLPVEVAVPAEPPVPGYPAPVSEVELPPAPPAPTQPEPRVELHQNSEPQAETPHTNARIESALEHVPGVVRGTEIEQPEPKRQFQPDPMPIETISLGNEKDSPKMRLFRNQRFNQMAIVFESKPDLKYIDQLRDVGYRFRDGGWTKQINREEKWKSHADAERLFREIANGIRADHGLDPVQAVGM